MLSLEAERNLLVLREDHEHLFFIGKGSFEAIYRPLTLLEARMISGSNMLEVELNDWIVKRCCLYITGGMEQLLSIAPAGIADGIAQAILDCSQFQSEEAIEHGITQAREDLKLFENSVALFILIVFRNLTPKDIDNMTFYQQMKYLALAEEISGKRLAIGAQMEEKVDGKGRTFNKRLSPEAAAILARQAADKPDIAKDNKSLSQFIDGRDRMK